MPKQKFGTYELPEEDEEPPAEPPAAEPPPDNPPADADDFTSNQYAPLENEGEAAAEEEAPQPSQPFSVSPPPAPALPPAEPTVTGQMQPAPTAVPQANVLPVQPPADDSPAVKLKQFVANLFGKSKGSNIPKRLKPLLTSALVGLGIFFLFNSQALIGQIQYLTNSGSNTEASAVDITADETVPAEPVIIIPKINVNVPVVYDVATYDEGAIQKALERGVVHYHNTALPGQAGNNVIVGHSSNNWWASGQYKFAFVLLNKLEVGDTFILHYNSKKYIYQVSSKRIVEPNDLSVVQPTTEPVVTLITCDPPGTALRRLVVTAKQISPGPASASTPATQTQPDQQIDSPLPGNSPSLWEQMRRRLFGD
jgi:LPXTG-site transpeptidase (sortase) family protein